MTPNLPAPQGFVASTFSIVGRDSSGLLGIAVTSKVLAVGAHVPSARARQVAIASQAYLHPYLAIDVLARLADGESLQAATSGALAANDLSEWRQFIAIGPDGPGVAHSGDRIDQWAGHVISDDCVGAGNLLMGRATLDEMVGAFDSNPALELSDRLLISLRAGQLAGGDRRGRQSAALLVVASEAVPYIDLRVDDHPDPVAELARIRSLLSEADLERALRTATTREPRPAAELEERQSQLHATLAEEEGKPS